MMRRASSATVVGRLELHTLYHFKLRFDLLVRLRGKTAILRAVAPGFHGSQCALCCALKATRPEVRNPWFGSIAPVRGAGTFRVTHARAQQNPHGLGAIGLTGAESEFTNRIHFLRRQQDKQAVAASSDGLSLVPWHRSSSKSQRERSWPPGPAATTAPRALQFGSSSVAGGTPVPSCASSSFTPHIAAR
jgi:hypothetical protein